MENDNLFEGLDQLPSGPTGYPHDADEWWVFVHYYKERLRDLVGEFHPRYARFARPMSITAPGAEAVCNSVREEVEAGGGVGEGTDPLVLFDRFVKEKDKRLASLLNETWFGIPESRDVHSLPAFGVLCDLCSESGCLFPEEQ